MCIDCLWYNTKKQVAMICFLLYTFMLLKKLFVCLSYSKYKNHFKKTFKYDTSKDNQ